MPLTLTVSDESVPGGSKETLQLSLLTERCTVREIIRSRVYQEVSEHNARQRMRTGRTLVSLPEPDQPDQHPTEALLNGPRRKPTPVDWEHQLERAITAFKRSSFLVLIDDQQVTELDQVLELTPATKVTFLRLVPLVGG